MTETEKQSWGKVRARGRDRFLLQSIARAGWILPIAAVIEVCWWLITGKLSEPAWNMVVKWAGMALAFGAVSGVHEWKTNERGYRESEADNDRR